MQRAWRLAEEFMNKDRWTHSRFALLGFGITALLFVYRELTNYSDMNPILILASIILCSASLLTLLLGDIEPHTDAAVFVWFIIGVINSGLYAIAGAVARRFLWRMPSWLKLGNTQDL
jgi:Na+/melibiose symporter-like transporter